MGYETEFADIETEFMTQWTYTPIANQNVNFNPDSYSEWVRLSVLPASAKQISLGNGAYYRYRGIMTVQIFTKPGSGERRSTVLSDLVTSIFRSKKVGVVQFEVPAATHLGAVSGWNQVNVNCPYYREEQ